MVITLNCRHCLRRCGAPRRWRLRLVAELADPRNLAFGVRPANRVGDSSESHPGEKVSEVRRRFLDRHDLADLERVAEGAHNDAGLRMAVGLEGDLAAIPAVAGLRVAPQGAGRSVPSSRRLNALKTSWRTLPKAVATGPRRWARATERTCRDCATSAGAGPYAGCASLHHTAGRRSSFLWLSRQQSTRESNAAACWHTCRGPP